MKTPAGCAQQSHIRCKRAILTAKSKNAILAEKTPIIEPRDTAVAGSDPPVTAVGSKQAKASGALKLKANRISLSHDNGRVLFDTTPTASCGGIAAACTLGWEKAVRLEVRLRDENFLEHTGTYQYDCCKLTILYSCIPHAPQSQAVSWRKYWNTTAVHSSIGILTSFALFPSPPNMATHSSSHTAVAVGKNERHDSTDCLLLPISNRWVIRVQWQRSHHMCDI